MKKEKYIIPLQSEKVVIEFTGDMGIICKWFKKNLLAEVSDEFHTIKKENYDLTRGHMVMHIKIK